MRIGRRVYRTRVPADTAWHQHSLRPPCCCAWCHVRTPLLLLLLPLLNLLLANQALLPMLPHPGWCVPGRPGEWCRPALLLPAALVTPPTPCCLAACPTSKRLPDTLVPHAHAKQRELRPQLLDHRQADAAVCGLAWGAGMTAQGWVGGWGRGEKGRGDTYRCANRQPRQCCSSCFCTGAVAGLTGLVQVNGWHM